MLEILTKLTYRNLRKDASYAVINAAGYIIGITSAIILLAFVIHELSYDKFHADHEKIYRLTTTFYSGENETHYALNEGIWDPILEDVNGIKNVTSFYSAQGNLVLVADGRTFSESRGLFSDSDFLKVFDFKTLSGERGSALQEPNSIVLTRSLAEKLFNTNDVYGKTLIWKDEERVMKITGVVEDVPLNSHIQFDYIVSGSTVQGWVNHFNGVNRSGNIFHIFFKTRDVISLPTLQARIDKSFETTRSKDEKKGFRHSTPIQKLTDIYFNATNQFELTAGGNYDYVKIFFLVAIALLLISAVNYVNLSTARALTRAKEVGVRKSLGITRIQLGLQFLTESVFFTMIATLISVFLAYWILQNFITSWFPIEVELFKKPIFIITAVLLGMTTGLLAGIYPAFKLASFNTIEALKGKVQTEKETSFSPRNALVLVQLSITVVLIAFSIVIFRQIEYLNKKSLGYNKEDVMMFTQPSSISDGQWKSFYDQLAKLPVVKSMGASYFPILEGSDLGRMSSAHFSTKDVSAVAAWNSIDNNFMKTLKMDFVEGRGFSEEHPSDTSAVIINETAKAAMGYEEAIGKKMHWWKGEFEVIGVVRDFHFQSFQNKVSPVIFVLNSPSNRGLGSRIVLARIEGRNWNQAISQIQSLWDDIKIEAPFEYGIFDDHFQLLLAKENQTYRIIISFTVICLIVTGIGLLGLIGYTVERRKKEMGIRKVLGATTGAIMLLFSKSYFKLILVSACIALPLGYYLQNYWMENFAYRAEVNVDVYFFTMSILCFFLFSIVGFKSFKAAGINPAEILKNE